MASQRPITEVQVASLGLGLLRESPIASFDEDNPRARRCNQWFALARDEVFRERDFNFTTAYVTPSLDAMQSTGTLKNRYVLPDDCLRVRNVDTLETDEWAVENAKATVGGAVVESNVLVCNITAPIICYSRRITDVRLWDAQAIAAIASKLAAYMAASFGKSFAEASGLETTANNRADRAARTDAREKADTEISRDTTWTRGRTGARWRR